MEFVQVDPTRRKNHEGGKSNVRKAAMRAFRRKERLERVRAFQARLAMESDEMDKSTIPSISPTPASGIITQFPPENSKSVPSFQRKSFQEDTWPSQVPVTNDVMSISPAADDSSLLVAPPSSIPTDWISLIGHLDQDNTALAYLFNYFLSIMLPIMLPFDSKPGNDVVQSYWENSLLGNPQSLQVAVNHVTLHLDETYKQRASVLSAIHVRHTVNLVNKRRKADSMGEKFIEAVQISSANSHMTGVPIESAIHMNAIRELVRMQAHGGSVSSRNIQAEFSWLDITPEQLSTSLPRLAYSFVESTALDVARPFTKELSETYKQESLSIIDELRALTELKTTIEASPEVSLSDIGALNSTRNALEKRMLCCQYAFYTQPDLKFEDRFLEACSIASSIYTTLIFRHFPLDFPILATLKQDLIDSIKKAESSFNSLRERPGAGTPYAETLFWVLILGGIMSLNDGEKTWFAQRIAMVLPWTLIRNWEEAEACLRRVSWTDKLYSGTCVSLWDEVELISGLRSPFIEADDFEITEHMIY